VRQYFVASEPTGTLALERPPGQFLNAVRAPASRGERAIGNREDYLALAAQADKAAAEAQTSVARNAWQAIARQYRAFAAQKRKLAETAS